MQSGQVLLMRHAEGLHQYFRGEKNLIDPLLTGKDGLKITVKNEQGEEETKTSEKKPKVPHGEDQAESWAPIIGDFKPDVVLMSPLRRCVQTGCLAFSKCEAIKMRLVRRAREAGWKMEHGDTQFGPVADLRSLLEDYELKYNRVVEKFDDAVVSNDDDDVESTWPVEENREKKNETFNREHAKAFINMLEQMVQQGLKVFVVTHGCLIDKITTRKWCGVFPSHLRPWTDNAEVLVCEFAAAGELKVVERFQHPEL
jgi:broad specificity phosphatase PhoE